MNNAAELEQEHHQKPNIYHINTDVAVLKSENKNTKERLDDIDESLHELTKGINELGKSFTEFSSASNARHKVWLFIFSLLGAATVILKLLGVNI